MPPHPTISNLYLLPWTWYLQNFSSLNPVEPIYLIIALNLPPLFPSTRESLDYISPSDQHLNLVFSNLYKLFLNFHSWTQIIFLSNKKLQQPFLP